MNRFLNLALLLLCAVAVVEIYAAIRLAFRPAPRPPTPLERFQARLEGSYHDCVPLGWYPERLATGRYFPSVNLDIAIAEGPFQALWVGIVAPGAERDARVASVKAVLDQLVDAGLLSRTDDPRGLRYNVTKYGQRFYYDEFDVSGNSEDWPYVCYSKLHVTGVRWDARYPDTPGPARSVTKHILVAWRAQDTAPWASPFLRAHSVELAPTTEPASAIVRHYVDGEWLLLSFQPAGPVARWPAIPAPAPRGSATAGG